MFYSKDAVRVAKSETGSTLVRSPQQRSTVTAAMQGLNNGGAGSNRGAAGGRGSTLIGGFDILTPYIGRLTHQQLCIMYEDIYFNDGLAGSVIDLKSDIPFGDFKLNIPVKKNANDLQDKFDEVCANLHTNTLMPPLARETLTFGAHVSMLLYSAAKKTFTNLIPFPYSSCDITDNFVYGMDPIVRVNVPQSFKDFIKDDSEYAKETLQRINPDLVRLLKMEQIELDKDVTSYIPRKSFTFRDHGTSLLRRIVPYYLLEKVLFRGTITMANRRQTAITHIQAGSDDWEPQADEMQKLVDMITSANFDPIGAVIATRNDVNISDFNPGDGFIKWQDISSDLADRKMLALGASEAFLSGDSTYDNQTNAIGVFLEDAEMFRGNITNRFFYNKVFPLVSATNDFTKDRYEISEDFDMITARVGGGKIQRYVSEIDRRLMDKTNLIIPRVEWAKQLIPSGGADKLQLMQTLEGMGAPLTVRAYAAAAGYDLTQLMDEAEASVSDMKRIKEIRKVMASYGIGQANPDGSMGDGSDGGPTGYSDDDSDSQSSQSTEQSRTWDEFAQSQMLPKVGLGKRKFTEAESELVARTVTGKRKWVVGQDRRNRESNEVVERTLSRMNDELNNRTRSYPSTKKGKS